MRPRRRSEYRSLKNVRSLLIIVLTSFASKPRGSTTVQDVERRSKVTMNLTGVKATAKTYRVPREKETQRQVVIKRDSKRDKRES